MTSAGLLLRKRILACSREILRPGRGQGILRMRPTSHSKRNASARGDFCPRQLPFEQERQSMVAKRRLLGRCAGSAMGVAALSAVLAGAHDGAMRPEPFGWLEDQDLAFCNKTSMRPPGDECICPAASVETVMTFDEFIAYLRVGADDPAPTIRRWRARSTASSSNGRGTADAGSESRRLTAMNRS